MGDFVALIRKKLDILDTLIEAEEARVVEQRSRMSDQPWYERRAGLTKRLYNLYEERQVLMLKSLFPEKTLYGQAKYVAYELPDGRLVPIKDTRIADGVYVSGDEVQPLELKTSSTLKRSVRGGKKVDVDFKSSSYIKQQISKEKRIIREAIARKAKIVMACDDPVTQTTVQVKVKPENLRLSGIQEYGKVPDAMSLARRSKVGQLIGRTLAKVDKAGNIRLERPKTSTAAPASPPNPPRSTQGRATDPGRPSIAERATGKLREQGPVEIGKADPGAKSTGSAGRLSAGRALGGAARLAGAANLALAPVSVYQLSKEFSGEAEAERAVNQALSGLDPQSFNAGDRFIVRYNRNGLEYDLHFEVETIKEWPYNLLPKPIKRFVALKAEPALI